MPCGINAPKMVFHPGGLLRLWGQVSINYFGSLYNFAGVDYMLKAEPPTSRGRAWKFGVPPQEEASDGAVLWLRGGG